MLVSLRSKRVFKSRTTSLKKLACGMYIFFAYITWYSKIGTWILFMYYFSVYIIQLWQWIGLDVSLFFVFVFVFNVYWCLFTFNKKFLFIHIFPYRWEQERAKKDRVARPVKNHYTAQSTPKQTHAGHDTVGLLLLDAQKSMWAGTLLHLYCFVFL